MGKENGRFRWAKKTDNFDGQRTRKILMGKENRKFRWAKKTVNLDGQRKRKIQMGIENRILGHLSTLLGLLVWVRTCFRQHSRSLSFQNLLI